MMKVSMDKSLVQKMNPDFSLPETPSLSHQYICCVLNIHGGGGANGCMSTGPKGAKRYAKAKYQQKSVGMLKRLALMQIFCGFVIFGSQIVPMYWDTVVRSTRDVSVNLYGMMDGMAAGIWSGLYIAVTGFIGMAAVRKNRFGLIVTSLVMNLCALGFVAAVVTFTVMTIGELRFCKMNGASFDYRHDNYNYNYNYNHDMSTTTRSPKAYSVFGEKLVLQYNNRDRRYVSDGESRFYCEAQMFCVWLGLEGLMIIGSAVTLGATIWLIVKNGTALCSCCRECCDKDEVQDGDDVSMVKAAEDALHI